MKILFESWRRYIKESLEVDQEKYDEWKREYPWDDDIPYKMKISDDEFIHFTPLERAIEIIESGRLLMNPPYEKFGIDAVTAVSAVYGSLIPGVQITHINLEEGETLAAVLFKTDIIPEYGRSEEAVWKEDVIFFSEAKLLDADDAINMLESTPEKISETGIVYYYF
jgi:hypothetical protein